MQYLILCLALCIGAALAQPAPQSFRPNTAPNPNLPAPPGLSPELERAWNVWANSPGVKSVAIIQLDATTFTAPSVTVNIGGKTHILVGNVTRRERQVFEYPNGSQPAINPGVVIWQGEHGLVNRYDNGGISGELLVPVDATGNIKQRYLVTGNPSNGGVIWLVAADRMPRHLDAPDLPASGAQR